MQKFAIAFLGAGCLLAAPAFAQSSTPTNSAGSTGTRAGSESPSPKAMQIRQKLMNDLQKDGFTNVNIIADSFLVHAKNKEGDPVVMIVNPDSVFSMTQVSENTRPGSMNGGASMNRNGMNGGAASANPGTGSGTTSGASTNANTHS